MEKKSEVLELEEAKELEWIDTKQGKEGEALLIKALDAYGIKQKFLVKNEDGTEEWKYYPTGVNANGMPVGRVKIANAEVRGANKKPAKYLDTKGKATVRFLTQGGKKVFYFDGLEKEWRAESADLSSFRKLVNIEIDGIPRKKPKPIN